MVALVMSAAGITAVKFLVSTKVVANEVVLNLTTEGAVPLTKKSPTTLIVIRALPAVLVFGVTLVSVEIGRAHV